MHQPFTQGVEVALKSNLFRLVGTHIVVGALGIGVQGSAQPTETEADLQAPAATVPQGPIYDPEIVGLGRPAFEASAGEDRAAGGAPVGWAKAVVASPGALPQFYFLRRRIFQSLADNDEGRAARLRQSVEYGPYQTGHVVILKTGVHYVFLPICDGELNLAAGRVHVVPIGLLQDRINLRCP